MDLSALRKFEISGPDAEELLQRTCTRNIRKLSVGQVVYTAMCYDHGGINNLANRKLSDISCTCSLKELLCIRTAYFKFSKSR
jgi:hypothetical protein